MKSPFPNDLLIGADGWNWDDWVGPFYPEGTPKSEYLAQYARRYPIVEVDSTFYRIPRKDAVRGWVDQTPEDFLFCPKVPRGVTHSRFQGDHVQRLAYFLEVMGTLGTKLGPVLFQFPFYNQEAFSSVSAFIDAFEPVLASVPSGYQVAVEVRNKGWVVAEFLGLLRRYNAAFVLVDHPWAEDADVLVSRMDMITADFCYIRWLGHHTKLEELTERWDHIIIDRIEETTRWVKILKDLLGRNVKSVYGIYRNRYAGYAPGSIELLRDLWGRAESQS